MRFEERHANTISKLKLVLILVCLVAIPLSFWINHHDLGTVNNRVTRIESPCARYGPKSRACRIAFKKAIEAITHDQACALLEQAGFQPKSCTKGGDALQTPAHSAHQQPGPPSKGGPRGHQGVETPSSRRFRPLNPVH